MVATANTISYGEAKLEYDSSKRIDGILVANESCRHNLYGESPSEIIHEMSEIQQSYRPNLEKYLLDIMVSMSEADTGKVRSSEERRKLLEEYMHTLMVERLGLTERQFQEMQWIAYEHKRTENNNLFHWHILANRIVIDGTLISDSHIGKKAVSVANAMSEKYGLSNARAISLKNKREIRDAAYKVLGRMPEFSFDLFKQLMGEDGHPIREAYSKSGRLQGYYVTASSGTEYKASEIDRSLTIGRIEDTWHRLNMNVLKKRVGSRPVTNKSPKRLSRTIPRVWNGINSGTPVLPRFKGHGSAAASQGGSQSAASNDRHLDDEEWEAKRRKGLSM
jgi:hypothetical protein